MPDSLTPGAQYEFIFDCEEKVRSACVGESAYQELKGKTYCVLHFPGKKNQDMFEDAIRRKIKERDFDFSGVWFEDRADFREVAFSADAEFYFAKFRAPADFSFANF